AAAIALPQTLANGSPFPQRSMIIFLAFSVILVTLVLQGLTLPPLIRALGIAGTPGANSEENEARRAILQAALDHLEKSRKNEDPAASGVYDDLERHYRHRMATIAETQDESDTAEVGFYQRFVELSRDLARVERETAVRLRNQRHI